MFFQSPAQWTSDAGHAHDFGTSPKAILYAIENGLNEVEVYWDFEDPEFNVRLPVASDSRQLAA